MRLSLKHQDRTEVLSVMPQQISVVTFEYLDSIRAASNDGNIRKRPETRKRDKRTSGSVKVMRIIYLFHLITSLVRLGLWGTMLGIARRPCGSTRGRVR
jgi:hypothetical protein